jgi:PAS domain S-box-containing protein
MRNLEDRLFVGLLEAAPDAMVCVDGDGRIALVNAQAERLFGYGRDELVGQPVEMLVPDAVRAVHPEHRSGYVADPKPRPMGAGMELAGRRRDGSTFPAEISLSAIDTEEGILVTAAVRDVTERQRADARFVGLLEAAPDAMVCVDGDGRIALVNAQAERLFGYGRDELVGHPVEMLVPDAVRAVHPGHRSGYLADPRLRPMGAGMELAGRRRDGSAFPAEISLSAIDTEEGILVTAAVRDVTERLEVQAERERLKSQAERDRLERQLQQSQRLESLGQLAGGVAHDFNNLLGVITNYAAFVAEELKKPPGQLPDESALSDMKQIQLAAERATRLTHQLLAFARREIVQPRVLNLNNIVVSILNLLQRTLGEHIELVTDLAPDLDVVLADPGHIEQILVNLAVNARDAMTGGGKLTIQTSNVDVDEAYAATHANLPTGRYAAMQVSDNGSGMPPEVADRAFEPFFSTKPKGEGSGLGLATIYGIVTQAGGNIRIYSEPHLGTTVTVLLPVTDQLPPSGEQAPGKPERGNGELVLLVEDEPAIREVTRRILTRSGYQVISAASGQEAVSAATTCPDLITLLVTDVIMPGMQGREVAGRVSEIQPGIAVLYMSGYTEGLLSAQGVLEPGINLIEKPFTAASLLTKMREILHARRPV